MMEEVLLRIALISVNGASVQGLLMAEFSKAGGGIGSDERNTLVLSDPLRRLSRVQAVVRFEQGFYHLYDQGLPRMLVNGVPLHKGQGRALQNDDLIEVSGFVMRVTMHSGALMHKPKLSTVVASAPWGVDSVALNVSKPVIGALPLPVDAMGVDPFDELIVVSRTVQRAFSGHVDTIADEPRTCSGGQIS